MTSIDKTAPKLVSTFPQKGSTAIPVNQDLVLTFNENVQLGTGAITISNGAGDTRFYPPTASEISVSGQKVILNPAKDLLPNSHYTVTIANTAIQDTSGNKYAGIKNTTTLYFDTVDTLAPTVTKNSVLASSSGVASNANIVLTFSEKIQAGTGTITLTSGSDLRTIAITDKQVKLSGTTLTINPTVDLNVNSTYKVHLDAGVIKDPVNNGAAAVDLSFTTKASGDKQAPVLKATTVINAGASDNIQLTFQENIKIGKGGFTLVNSADSADKLMIDVKDPQVSIANNVLTINPTNNLKPEATYLLTAPKGIVTDMAKNAFAGLSAKAPFTFDTHDKIAPTLTITDDKTSATNSAILYTFTASEAINGFTADDITVTGGSKGEFKAIAGTNNYTLSVTPDANSTTPVTVSVATGRFTDLVNNANSAATSTQAVDTVAPTVTITDDKTGVATSSVLYTFTLSEESNTFTLDDVTVTGGSKAATLTTVSPKVYTLSVTPDTNSTTSIKVDVAVGKFTDAVGNINLAAMQNVQEVDTVSPSVMITDDKSAVTNSTIMYTFTLSAPSANFSIDDINVTGGKPESTLTAVSSTVYTLSVTPDANSITPVTVDVAAGKFTDASGLSNIAATQNSQSIDTAAPTIKIEDNQTGIATSGTIIYTLTLSEPSNNFNIEDIAVTGGTKASTLTTVSSTVYTLSVSPKDNSTTPVTVDVASGKFTDAVGNNNIAAVQSVQEVKTVPTLGKAIDGYLAGSTVTVGTYTTTTDANGNFTLPSSVKGEVVVSGGTDLSTGKAFKGVLKAPEGSSTVTPLTTVQQGFIASGQTPAQAQASVAKAFGFSSAVDLTKYDPIDALKNATATDKDNAIALMANAAKIANFLVTAGETLKGAGGDKVTAATAGDAILKSLVNSVSSAGSTGVIDLGNASLLTAVLNDSAKEVAKTVTGTTDNFAAKITAMAATVASVIKDATDNIAAVVTTGGSSDALLTGMGNVSKFTQEGASAKLQDIAKTLDLTNTSATTTLLASAVSTLTGDAADKSISKGSSTPDPVVSPSSGGSGGTPAPSTTTTSLDALSSTISSPYTFDASTSAFVLTDNATTANFIKITGYSSNDAINFTNIGSNHLVVSSQGQDVKFQVNANGTVSEIVLVGVNSDLSTIVSLAGFNALSSLGDVTVIS